MNGDNASQCPVSVKVSLMLIAPFQIPCTFQLATLDHLEETPTVVVIPTRSRCSSTKTSSGPLLVTSKKTPNAISATSAGTSRTLSRAPTST